MTENFFGLLKKEMFYGHEYDYKDYDSFVKALDEYIVWYNHSRIKLRLLMSPSQYQETFKS
jgi:transposase InsO family protein